MGPAVTNWEGAYACREDQHPSPMLVRHDLIVEVSPEQQGLEEQRAALLHFCTALRAFSTPFVAGYGRDQSKALDPRCRATVDPRAVCPAGKTCTHLTSSSPESIYLYTVSLTIHRGHRVMRRVHMHSSPHFFPPPITRPASIQ